MHTATSPDFPARARAALRNATLQQAMDRARDGFVAKRARQVADLPEFEALRDAAAAVKDDVLAHLDDYLTRYEAAVTRTGGQVHWARDAAEARAIVLAICARVGARTVTKGKSMVGEEIGLNAALAGAGIEPVETDLGEYILQLAGEAPSHIIAPAVHKTKEQIADLFQRAHGGPRLEAIPDLVDAARRELRQRYFRADVGITGANFLIAETGSSVIVTNEGNGDLTQTLAPVHIVTAGIERVVPTLEDASLFLRLLARSATGQDTETYTTFSTGPRRAEDPDGPREYHVVLVDNGRSRMRAGPYRAMLRCIRCGACMNHCPVYSAIGGHAYGWVYPGPMGAVLTPLIQGLDAAWHLPHACTLNGRCAEVCPVRIPLPDLLRGLRAAQFQQGLVPRRRRLALALWRAVATRPRLYHGLERLAARLLAGLARGRGRLPRLPGAGGWTAGRDLPAPAGRTFLERWQAGDVPTAAGDAVGSRRGAAGQASRAPGRADERKPAASARAVILAALGGNGSMDPARIVRRVPPHPTHPIPAWDGDPLTRFIARLTAHSGTCERLPAPEAIPAAMEAFRAAHGLARVACIGAGLGPLPWPADWALSTDPAGPDTSLAVSPAFAGVAETGQLVLLAGPDSPTTHNFVPDNQLIVLPLERLAPRMEQVWAWLRARPGGLPRVVNCIAGPSRTADIEQTIQLGAHGPRRLHVLLIG